MIDRSPCRTLAELDAMDESDMVNGYLDGFKGEPEPGDNHSKSYWHGWRNGAVDGHHRDGDDAQIILAHLIVERARALRRSQSHD